MRYPKRKGLGRYRSGLEKEIGDDLRKAKVPVKYETEKIRYTKPASSHTYTPDFVLPNGIIVEAKGFFSTQDRKKHILVKQQYPDLDIRFVFSSSKKKLYKGSKTSYADWCDKHGFIYADKLIPKEWLNDNTSDNS